MPKGQSSTANDNGQDVRTPQPHSKTPAQTTKKPSKKHNSSKSTGRSKSDEDSHSESESMRGFNFDLPCEDNWHEVSKVDLQAGGRRFWLYENKLREFSALSSRLDKAPKHPGSKMWKLLVLEENANDVRNMLTVLHATLYQPNNFEIATLKSTLKLAAKYDHPDLRKYAIQQLEKHSLPTIDRVALSCKYKIHEWMSGAIDELCSRDEPITVSESLVLGTELLTRVAARREKIRYEKGRNAGINQTPKSTGAIIDDSPPTTPRPIPATKGPFALSTPAVTPFKVKLPFDLARPAPDNI